MQLSSEETRSVILIGLGGLATAVLYQLGTIFLKQSSDNIKLDPETEVLHTHSELLHLFVQLAQHRSYCEKAYRMAVISADNLVLRVKQAHDKIIKVSTDDVIETVALQSDVVKQVKKLEAAAMKAGNSRAAAQVESLLEKLYPELQRCHMEVQRALVHLYQ